MSRPALLLAGLWLVGSAAAGPLPYGDPTQPTPLGRPIADATSGGEAVVEGPRWKLTSTLVAGERRVAVINGRSAAVGATIEGARVLSVDSRGATIEHQGRRIRLDLPAPAGKTVTAKTPSGR